MELEESEVGGDKGKEAGRGDEGACIYTPLESLAPKGALRVIPSQGERASVGAPMKLAAQAGRCESRGVRHVSCSLSFGETGRSTSGVISRKLSHSAIYRSTESISARDEGLEKLLEIARTIGVLICYRLPKVKPAMKHVCRGASGDYVNFKNHGNFRSLR